MYGALLNHPDRDNYDLSTLRVCVVGRRAAAGRGAARLREGVRLRRPRGVRAVGDLAGRVVQPWPTRQRKPGSIGTPGRRRRDAPGRRPTARTSPAGSVGEIADPRPQRDEGLLEQARGDRRGDGADGWFSTGDMATVDEDGYFFIVDRKKDMIIRGGYNVYPREIEEVLYEHEAVREAAVVGVPHPSSARRSAPRSRRRPGVSRRRGAAELRQGARRGLQVPAPDLVRRRAPEGADGQDPQARDHHPRRLRHWTNAPGRAEAGGGRGALGRAKRAGTNAGPRPADLSRARRGPGPRRTGRDHREPSASGPVLAPSGSESRPRGGTKRATTREPSASRAGSRSLVRVAARVVAGPAPGPTREGRVRRSGPLSSTVPASAAPAAGSCRCCRSHQPSPRRGRRRASSGNPADRRRRGRAAHRGAGGRPERARTPRSGPERTLPESEPEPAADEIAEPPANAAAAAIRPEGGAACSAGCALHWW